MPGRGTGPARELDDRDDGGATDVQAVLAFFGRIIDFKTAWDAAPNKDEINNEILKPIYGIDLSDGLQLSDITAPKGITLLDDPDVHKRDGRRRPGPPGRRVDRRAAVEHDPPRSRLLERRPGADDRSGRCPHRSAAGCGLDERVVSGTGQRASRCRSQGLHVSLGRSLFCDVASLA